MFILVVKISMLICKLSYLGQWCGLLWTTGGLIVPWKSKWWLIDFEWTGEDFVY